MPKGILEFINQVKKWWATLDANQRSLLIILGVVLGLGVIGLSVFAVRPDYTVLYSNLEPKDANEVVEYLREQKVPYRLGGGGTQVEVPSKRVYDLRVQLAGKGLPRGGNVGFEIFDKMSLGVTDQVQRINYLRALQSELERTIDSLEVIEKSRVHLVMPQDDMWFEDQAPPTGSVLVKLRTGGTLPPQLVDSIRHLLSSAVRGLTPERVTIVDTQGRVLSTAGDADGSLGLSDRQIGYKKTIETNLKTQAESVLSEILGQGKAAVRVSVDIDFNQILTERESYTPVVGRQGLVRSEKQNMFESAADKANAGGVAGTASNLQGYPPAGAAGGDKSTKKNERVINYEMNRTMEKIHTATGSIRQISVGIFIDGKFTPEQLADLTGVLSRGLGIKPDRGDVIEVKAFPFNRKGLEEEKKLLEQSQKQQFWIRVLTRWVPLGLLLTAAGTFLFMGMGSLKRLAFKGALEQRDKKNGGENDEGEVLTAESIAAMLRQNASGSAQILKHWLGA